MYNNNDWTAKNEEMNKQNQNNPYILSTIFSKRLKRRSVFSWLSVCRLFSSSFRLSSFADSSTRNSSTGLLLLFFLGEGDGEPVAAGGLAAEVMAAGGLGAEVLAAEVLAAERLAAEVLGANGGSTIS